MKISIFILLLSCITYAQMSPEYVKLDSRVASVKRLSNSYKFYTNENLRDNLSKKRTILIDTDFPYIDSNSNMFNALFSLAIEEMKENMVNSIYDSSFGQDQCNCFETGKKWNYVWTRDIAYSVNLALADLAPKRSMNSLLFKVSNMRGKGNSSSQIVQDTGTGGSWPISTDRVTWSLGALKLLDYLKNQDKRAFAKTAYIALTNTVEADREIVYDKETGLYTGEQSFLDWREQTYPHWTKENTIHIGMSKSLSTNIAHYIALKTLVRLGKVLGKSSYQYNKWSKDLKENINKYFWDSRRKLYSLMLTTYLDQTKVDKFDLLGNSLAVIFEIVKSSQQQRLLKDYNMTSVGAPVIFPQDTEAPIYHNRAIWPFVSAYALLASKTQKQSQIFNHLFQSIINGAALNLSNMENFEFTTLKNFVSDGYKSGPVVNSQRQLWSVAGFLSTYLEGIFGKVVKDDAINFNPFITSKIRNSLLSNSNSIELKNFSWKGKKIDIQIKLPNQEVSNESSYFKISKKVLNGKELSIDQFTSFDDLKASNKFIITLVGEEKSFDRVKITRSNFYSAQTPSIKRIEELPTKLKIHFEGASSYNIYQDNQILKQGHSKDYLVISKPEYASCFAIEADSKNRSFHSEPICYWPINSITKFDINKRSSSISKSFNITKPGTYLLQLVFNNQGDLRTGITSSVKKITVFDGTNKIHTGYFFLPHTIRQADSNFIKVYLEKSADYKIQIENAFNMSYFDHFKTYIHRGGRSGKDNSAHIHYLKVLRSL